MKWFKHSSNLINRPKVKKLVMKKGAVGYGVYLACLEVYHSGYEIKSIDSLTEIVTKNLNIQEEYEKSGLEITREIINLMGLLELITYKGEKYAMV